MRDRPCSRGSLCLWKTQGYRIVWYSKKNSLLGRFPQSDRIRGRSKVWVSRPTLKCLQTMIWANGIKERGKKWIYCYDELDRGRDRQSCTTGRSSMSKRDGNEQIEGSPIQVCSSWFDREYWWFIVVRMSAFLGGYNGCLTAYLSRLFLFLVCFFFNRSRMVFPSFAEVVPPPSSFLPFSWKAFRQQKKILRNYTRLLCFSVPYFSFAFLCIGNMYRCDVDFFALFPDGLIIRL